MGIACACVGRNEAKDDDKGSYMPCASRTVERDSVVKANMHLREVPEWARLSSLDFKSPMMKELRTFLKNQFSE